MNHVQSGTSPLISPNSVSNRQADRKKDLRGEELHNTAQPECLQRCDRGRVVVESETAEAARDKVERKGYIVLEVNRDTSNQCVSF